MYQAIVKNGKVVAEEIPSPLISPSTILIRVVNSCISIGTETSNVENSGFSMIKKAMKQPEELKKIINHIKAKGVEKAFERARTELTGGKQIGYSVSGIVIAVGEKIKNKFSIGDHVAAAGAGIANHAEIVNVPENLVVKIPLEMDFRSASTVAIGAIALQGVRRADLKLGEFAVVYGTGLIGLITIQLLKNSGIRVAAIDLNQNRLDFAYKFGAEIVINPTLEDSLLKISNWSGGYGVDRVLFTASTESSEPLSQSFQMCRKKGSVVLVGVSGLQIKREDIYSKELDFFISASYGPGRYDEDYEIKGKDYPYAYIRWTEKRNMEEYLRLVHAGKIEIKSMIENVYNIEEVSHAYESLKIQGNKPLMVVIEYCNNDSKATISTQSKIRLNSSTQKKINKGLLNVALIGAGSFARGVHLPNLKKLDNLFKLHAVCSQTGVKAKNIAEQFKANYATTNYHEILEDPEVDLILIATRHDSHADYTIKALQANKSVFVEKPLATSREELSLITKFYQDGLQDKPVLFVGYNRRFSPYSEEIKRSIKDRINPLFIRYRMNAGYVPMDNWIHMNGGRIVGEACHIIDLMTFFTESKIISINTESLTPKNRKFSKDDNKSFILKYEDGSICAVDYFSTGNKSLSKEFMEIHFDETSIIMDDYKLLQSYGKTIKPLSSKISQKGQFEELIRLHQTLSGKLNTWPIEFWDLIQTTSISLSIAEE